MNEDAQSSLERARWSGAAPRGRYAPSPTGATHIGNARTALVAWWSVRSRGGSFVWRLEDLDPPRIVAGSAEAHADDLAWLGLDWDEDPESGGPFAPYIQSERSQVYEAALEVLHAAGRLFPCTVSRRELASIASAPHGPDDEAPYPPSLRPSSLEAGWYDAYRSSTRPEAALRFRIEDAPVSFVDRVYGRIDQRVGGDFVLKRRDGLYAYQLAVVVDDWLMHVDEVVRGADLLGSTPRQIQLLEALGARRPAHAHVPVVRNAEGEKLSKRDAALTVRSLRDAGVRAPQLAGYLAWSLGLIDRPVAATTRELVETFAWNRIRPDDFTLPVDIVDVLKAVR